jgi:predicted helicase
MDKLNLKPTHKPVQNYYEALRQFKTIGVSHEGAVRSAFQTLLDHCGRQFGWKLVPEWAVRRNGGNPIRVDGALVDEYRLTYGYWEAKDTDDDLAKEVRKKLAVGYPQNNIIFQAPERAILLQNGRIVLDEDISQPDSLVRVLKALIEYVPPEIEGWHEAVEHFQNQIPEFGATLKEIIEREEKANTRFRAAFDDFFAVCRQSINPNLSKEAVEEMLIQHLLTERIFRTVFNNPDFTRRNVIASEIEKVIDALTSQAFSRDAFLQKLDRFYVAIDQAARTIEDFSQKQQFLNTVYEKFFQGFSVKVADTHGIVYTPVSIVNFMVRSVEDILQREFGKSLSSKDVHILDPFVGTGNFIVHIMQAIKKTALPQKYHEELHCNEVMLLPYYIASMNIEHEYFESVDKYKVFEGICLADTFDIMEEGRGRGTQMALVEKFNPENTKRVERQKQSPIFVVIGNPPYNTAQVNENDNNKNRKYKVVDPRVSSTYAKDSKATLLNKLSDPYVKAFRWASDRIGPKGIVAFVTNNSFIDQAAFDGMRKHLRQDFDELYILDLGGNVRRNPKLSGTTHNVFGIQVGVSINLLIRRGADGSKRNAQIRYAAVDTLARREEKYRYLEELEHRGNLEWQLLAPDENQTWLTSGLSKGFSAFMSLGSKGAKAARSKNVEFGFKTYSLGVSTNRDAVVYDFQKEPLAARVKEFRELYNSEVDRFSAEDEVDNLDDFLQYDYIKWSRNLKRALRNREKLSYSEKNIRLTQYRPFTQKYLYFANTIVDELGQNRRFFPTSRSEKDNRVIVVPSAGGRARYWCFCSGLIVNLNFTSIDGAQCFPFYTYREDGTNRRENITDWALEEFRSHYKDTSITKWDIFHYVYAVLHHPLYRERYAANLKRELPRIPLAPNFRAFADIGKSLAEIHVNYEQQPEYPLERIEMPGKPLDWRVEKMKLSKDKGSLIYNDFLTLSGIPPEVFEYRLGNRSALEWIIDQYQVSTDKRSGITNDPNRADEPEYISRLIGQVISVSVETVKLVSTLTNQQLVPAR